MSWDSPAAQTARHGGKHCKKLGLPDLLSAASLLEVLNTMMTRTELQALLETLA